MVIVAHAANEHFDQLASTLRRRGVRVVRVCGAGVGGTSGPQARTRWLRDRLLYDASIPLPQAASIGVLGRRLGAASIVDVLVSETALAAGSFSSPAVADLARRALAFAGQPAEVLLDKFAVNERLAQAGVRVPAQVCTSELTPQEAAAELGLPLIVKRPTGAAGSGVRLARTIQELEQAVDELTDGDPDNAFYQQHIDGRMMMYVCVRGPAGPLLEQGLEVLAAQWPLGPSAVVRLVDDPALQAAGRSVTQVLGCRGFADIGFLQDAAGDLWHVDANCRVWGNMASLGAAGLDFADAYAALLKHISYACARRPAPGEVIYAQPFALYQALLHGSAREVWSRMAEFSRMCRRGPGLAYALVVSIKAAAMLWTRLSYRLLNRPDPSNGPAQAQPPAGARAP